MNSLRLLAIFSVLICAGCINFGSSRQIEHKVKQNADGGFELSLTGTKRIYQPITAEGFFPTQSINYKVVLKGNGQNWTYRNQEGYYYSYPNDIEASQSHWDFGYAWVNKNRDTIFLNLFWVKAPDSLIESDVNGSYKVQP